ncbi:quinone oxidoreductase [Haloechinothrix salitolerans]|uniref:Quinone oxidoreductase n=1 Tax=Haloechinothrix salitolerans TaxID=926830 RepID=A0ABW2C5C8_9PSEU
MPKAIVVGKTGGPDVLEYTDVSVAEPGEGELLVDVVAAGVNFIDTYQRSGLYPRNLPFIAGVEGAGTVAAVGRGVSGVRVGDRVAWAMTPGSYAEQAVIPASSAVPVPDEADIELAAAVLLQGLTAHYLVTSVYPVRQGDVILVHAAAGGVGLLLTQLVRSRGGRVIATASTREKAELAKGAGAETVLGYDDFAPQVREITAGEGVAAVYDGVGKTTFDGSLDSLRVRGTLALFGASSGPVPPVDPQRLNSAGSVFLTRPNLANFIATRDELEWRAGELFDALSSGDLTVHIGGKYSLAEARQAHTDLEARKTTGKLLLRCS